MERKEEKGRREFEERKTETETVSLGSRSMEQAGRQAQAGRIHSTTIRTVHRDHSSSYARGKK